ncbi:heparan-alpha-glucosaminide N-acetyltransferase [Marinomonas balearica]|uniref:Putative membrane protein n=1 Tax=Marinomonas balearica TaxID=491947 RepID=A0A4R6MDD0_9GAMM|nr:heparan-alpha-glucosaminide N-acetyltransferase [Marinomonas balearica]TDO98720.1 putative membrane protein [Marinomonas balearica]
MLSLNLNQLHKPDNRSAFLDIYRGTAVLLMIVFHFCWDLRHFGYLDYSLTSPFWVGFRAVIVFLFLSAIGWSSYLAVQSGQPFSRFRKHMAVLLLAATSISLVTYIIFPKQWIFFGILHFIFLASIAVRPMARTPFISLALAVAIAAMYWLTDWFAFTDFKHVLYNDLNLPRKTVDIIAPIPWICAVFIGPIFGYLKIHTFRLPSNLITAGIAVMGRYALRVYLTHQIILFSLVATAHYLITKLT